MGNCQGINPQLKVYDKVRIVNDWLPPEAKAKLVVIQKFQDNGEPFAVIRWTGKGTNGYDEKFGTLFPLTELRKAK